MTIRELWALVAIAWLPIAHAQGFGIWTILLGLGICVVFAWRGFLANPRKGIRR